MKILSWVLITALCPILSLSAAQKEYMPAVLPDLPSRIHIEILPEIELISGVLSHTSWKRMFRFKGKGNAYYRELHAFFEPYKKHPAILDCEKLIRMGFQFHVPPNFMVSLSSLPDLLPINGYTENMISVAHGKHNLDIFRQHLADLASVSNFSAFFESHRVSYESYLRTTCKGFRPSLVVDWLGNFFGWQSQEFHLVFAPGMMPGGGYGGKVQRTDGSVVIYQFIRENGKTDGEPEFPSGIALEDLSLHEWGHSFLHLAFAKCQQERAKADDLFRPVAKLMRKNSYGDPDIFFNEQVLRAITILTERELYGEEIALKARSAHLKKGFYLLDYTVEKLQYYQTHRGKYKRFDEFLPILLEMYNKDKSALLKLIPK